MKIGLMGFEFKSANKGCEALVYSFISIISKKLKEGDIIYNFSGTDLGAVPEYFNDIKFVNVPPKLKDLKFKYIKSLSKCNIIFDVTMGDSFSDIYSKNYYRGLMIHKKLAGLLCKRYVLLPQTYGPFYSRNSDKVAKKVLNKAYKIYCRDEISQKLISEKFHINNSVLVSDMAFILPYDKNMFQLSSNKKLGLNISGLLFRGGFNLENQFNLNLDYRLLIEKLVFNLSKKYELHLNSHVIDLNNNSYDDDYKICKEMHMKFPSTILAPAFNSPIEAKSYISNMDIFIGSRMHSTIAAFSSGVVTIPISYSRKFEGVFGSLNYPYVINAKKEDTESAYNLVLNYIRKEQSLKHCQEQSLSLIKRKKIIFEKSISNIIEEI